MTVGGGHMDTFKAFWQRLRDSKKYRDHFAASQVKQAIPFQIRALMKVRGLSQEELAERSNLTQGAISRAASAKYGNLSVNTLVRIASGFDVAFVGRFVPFSELGRWLDHLHEESTRVPSFDEESLLLQKSDARGSSIGDSPSASTAARLGNQAQRSSMDELFRLTAPSLNPHPARVIGFPKPHQGNHAQAAADAMAVSQ